MLKHAKVYGSGPDKVGGPDWDADHVVDDAAALRTALGVAKDGPRFRAYPAADFAIGSGTPWGITFDTEMFDIGGCFDTSINVFKPDVPGYYQLNLGVTFASETSSLSHAIGYLYKNTSIYAVAQSRAVAADVYGVNLSDVMYLNGSTDYAAVMTVGIVGSGSVQVIGGGTFTFFSGHYIGA